MLVPQYQLFIEYSSPFYLSDVSIYGLQFMRTPIIGIVLKEIITHYVTNF